MAFQVHHNTPSPGYIAWTDLNISYKGQTYNLGNGNTNKRFVWWEYASPNTLKASDDFPDQLTTDDLVVFVNINGTAIVVPTSTTIPGDLIVPGTVLGDRLVANSITARELAAGAISADAVGAAIIASGAILSDHISAGAIAADHIAANAVTSDKIAANAIGAEKIAAGAITAEKLSIGRFTIAIDPNEAALFHFDSHLKSTQSLEPISGDGDLVPDGGQFGGGVRVETQLAYAVGASGKYTIQVHRDEVTLQDYAAMTLQQLEDM